MVRIPLGRPKRKSEVDRTGSGLCLLAVFGFSCVEPSDSAIRVLVRQMNS